MFSLVGGTVTVRGSGRALGTVSPGRVTTGTRAPPLGRGLMAAAGRDAAGGADAGVVMMYVVDDEPGDTAACTHSAQSEQDTAS